MADFNPLSALFGGDGSSGDPGFADRLNTVFMAMAATPPGGAMPLLQAAQLSQQQQQLQASRNAMTQALIANGVPPKVAAIAGWNPAAAQIFLQTAQQKQGSAVADKYERSSPPLPGSSDAQPATPAAIAPPAAPQAQSAPSVPAIKTVQANDTANVPSLLTSPGNLTDGGASAPSTLAAPPAMNLGQAPAPATGQFSSKADMARTVYAQNTSPPPPNPAQSPATQMAQWQAYYNHWNSALKEANNRNWAGLKAEAENNTKLAMQYLGPDANPDLQANIKGRVAAATFPYQAGITAMREGARPITVSPNQVVTTGAQVNPDLKNMLHNIAQATGGQQASVPPQTQTAQNSGVLSAGAPGVSQFTPRLVQNPDGSFSSSVTPGQEALQKQAAADYEDIAKTSRASQQTQYRLSLVEHDLDKLNVDPGMYNTGATANARLGVMKVANSVAQAAGIPPPFDPSKVASWEDLNKENIQLGFSMSRTMGARVAMQMVQQAIAANPGAMSTPQGAKLVLNSLRMAAKADTDYYDYVTKHAADHGGDLVGAQTQFFKEHPPQSYAAAAIAAGTAPNHVEYLKAHRGDPKVIQQFDAKYGQGASQILLDMP